MIERFYNYKLTWNDNHYIYVGSSNNPDKRLAGHKASCLSKRPNNTKLANVWKKHGQPTMTIMGTFETEEEMLEGEQFLIDQIFGESVCLNLNPKADRPPITTGIKHTAETKAKMSASRKGRVFTEESKAKMSASRKGKVLTEETRQKISISSMGKPKKPHSEEAKAKMSASAPKKAVVGTKENETIEFPSIRQAAEFIGKAISTISKCLSLKCENKTAGGYTWTYK